MIELVFAVGIISADLGVVRGQQPPGFDFFVCPGPDPRCRNRPPPANVTPPSIEPPAAQVSAGGSMRLAGTDCPVAMLPPSVIYFGEGDVVLSEQARAVLDEIAVAHRQSGAVSLTLSGHTDRAGSTADNVARSERYANSARDYLMAVGVPGAAITIRAMGESSVMVETADGVQEQQNRRVEITFAPSGGM